MIKGQLIGMGGLVLEFAKLDDEDYGLPAYEWLQEMGCDCDYSRSRETTYYNGDNEVDCQYLVYVRGLFLNLDQHDYDIFKETFKLVEKEDCPEHALLGHLLENGWNEDIAKDAVRSYVKDKDPLIAAIEGNGADYHILQLKDDIEEFEEIDK